MITVGTPNNSSGYLYLKLHVAGDSLLEDDLHFKSVSTETFGTFNISASSSKTFDIIFPNASIRIALLDLMFFHYTTNSGRLGAYVDEIIVTGYNSITPTVQSTIRSGSYLLTSTISRSLITGGVRYTIANTHTSETKTIRYKLNVSPVDHMLITIT